MGEIKNPDRASQIIEFEGMFYGKNIRPTDIDGSIEYRGKAFAYFELKYADTPLTTGQKIWLEHHVDLATAAHKPAIAFWCSHSVVDPHTPVKAKDTKVVRFICNNGWTSNGATTLGECMESWLRYTCPKALEE